MNNHPATRKTFVGLALWLGISGTILATILVSRAALMVRPATDPPWNRDLRVSDVTQGAPAPRSNMASATLTTTNYVFAIWLDGRNGQNDVYVARSADNGQTWGTAVRVSHDPPGLTHSHPDLAIDSNGVLHAV